MGDGEWAKKGRLAQGDGARGRIWFSCLPGSKLITRLAVSQDESDCIAVHWLPRAQTEMTAG